MSDPIWIRLEEVHRITELWPRAGLDQGRVSDFRRLYVEEGWETLPPVELVPDASGGYLLADGWHRLAALDGTEADRVPSIVLQVDGGHRDATSFVFERALKHAATAAKPLSRAEKQAAVQKLLADRPESSDREIARLAGVDHKTVGRYRRLGNSPTDPKPPDGAPPTPQVLARRLFQAMERVRETGGLGIADAVLGDRTAERLALILAEAHGGRAIERASSYRDWLNGAIKKLKEEAP